MSQYPLYRKRKTLNGMEYVKIVDHDFAYSAVLIRYGGYFGYCRDKEKILEFYSCPVSNKQEFEKMEQLILNQ